MRLQSILLTLGLGLAAFHLSPAPASAYLDPASGSIILQVVLGGIAGAGLLLKLYWHKLLRVVGLRRREHEGSDL